MNVTCRNASSITCAMWSDRLARWDSSYCTLGGSNDDNITCLCSNLTAYATNGVVDVASLLVYRADDVIAAPLLYPLRSRIRLRTVSVIVALAWAAFLACVLTWAFNSWR
jgi:hypothetical protein